MNIIFELVWTAINSPTGVVAMAGALLWGLNRLYAAKPLWRNFEGAIISGIKMAEKEIPAGTTNKGLAKLDTALGYVLKVYEETNRKRASSKVVAQIKEGIQITHNQLEATGTLK